MLTFIRGRRTGKVTVFPDSRPFPFEGDSRYNSSLSDNDLLNKLRALEEEVLITRTALKKRGVVEFYDQQTKARNDEGSEASSGFVSTTPQSPDKAHDLKSAFPERSSKRYKIEDSATNTVIPHRKDSFVLTGAYTKPEAKGQTTAYSSTSQANTVSPQDNTRVTKSPPLQIINVAGEFCYIFKCSRDVIVMKRVRDSWINVQQVWEAALLPSDVIYKKRCAQRLLGNSEPKFGPRNRARGLWISFETARDIIIEHGLAEILSPLLLEHSTTPGLPYTKAHLVGDGKAYTTYHEGVPYLLLRTNLGTVGRRTDTQWINCSMIAKVAGLGTVDRVKETDLIRRRVICDIVNGGNSAFQGCWASFGVGLALARKLQVEDLLSPILSDIPISDEDMPAEADPIRVLKSSGKAYYLLETMKGSVTQRISDNWWNASNILKISGLTGSALQKETALLRVGKNEIQFASGNYICGTWAPFRKGVKLALKHNVLELLALLLPDNGEYQLPMTDEDDDEESPMSLEEKWLELKATRHGKVWLPAPTFAENSTTASEIEGTRATQSSILNSVQAPILESRNEDEVPQLYPSDQKALLSPIFPSRVGQICIVSRNTDFRKNGRARLIRDGIATAESYCKAFMIKPINTTMAVGFNATRSIMPALSSTAHGSNNDYYRDCQRMIEAVMSTPPGTQCIIIIRGIDGYTTDLQSLVDFRNASPEIDLWICSAVPKSWTFSPAWRDAGTAPGTIISV
ncbi:hypothetical protein BP5796_05377 [Coleophoma crateriformis]|uniref:HTH APSES-type domain-containing protein n=1 Tax=Coleophoma crateriformis TaxID=565419 RepID=A0A3D8S318_9HELO|nr:hypothetical protein BP5796_05377 [Coleophoma crateriformis]